MEAKHQLLFSDVTGDALGRVTVTTELYDRGLARVTVAGQGNTEGMQAAARSFEAAFTHVEDSQSLWVIVELSGLSGASLTGQVSVVPWLLSQQHRIGYLGILGGDTTALQIAQSIVKRLPFEQRIGFFEDEGDLMEHLDGLAQAAEAESPRS